MDNSANSSNRFDGFIKLIKSTKTKDDIGNTIYTRASEDEVFANVESISANDFFAAQQANLKLDIKVTVYKHLYKNHSHVEVKGIVYKVERSFGSAVDYIELQCSQEYNPPV